MDTFTADQKVRRAHLLSLFDSIADADALTDDERDAILLDLRVRRDVILHTVPEDGEDEASDEVTVMVSRAVPDSALAIYPTLQAALDHCTLLGMTPTVVHEEPDTIQ